MKKKGYKLTKTEFHKALKEAQKNPEFIKEVNKFIKASTGIYKLH